LIKLFDFTYGEEIISLKNKKEKNISFINCLFITKDDKYILSGTQDNVNIFNAESGDLIKFIENPNEGNVWSICVSNDNKYLFTAGDDSTIKMFDFLTLKLLYSFNGHKQPIKSILITEDQKSIISGSLDETIKIWKIPSNFN
jgi:WD40 repeat protein